MSVIVGTFGDAIEQIRPWLTPAFLLGILGLLSRHVLAARKLDLDVERELREEIRKIKEDHRKDKKAVREELDSCERLRDEDREKIEALRDLVSGYCRVIIQHADAGGIVEFQSEEVQRAQVRVDNLFKRKAKDDGNTSR